MSEREERKNQRLGLVSSLGIHACMVLLFVFVMGWRAPNPPLSEMGSGIELNFGLDEQGGGDIQPALPPGSPESQATETKDNPKEPDQPKEESKPAVKLVGETKPDEVKAEKPLTSEEESPVTVKEPKKVVKPVTDVAKKPVDKKPTKDKATEAVQEEKITPINSTKPVAEVKKGDPGTSQGDNPGKKGDKGSPQGTLDAKALYGKPGSGGPGDGGGGGGGISMEGFVGFERPAITKPEIPNESYGDYVFLVKVNQDGEVISIKSLKKGISLDAEQIFKRTIENIEFVPKQTKLPAESEGTITFKVIAPPARK